MPESDARCFEITSTDPERKDRVRAAGPKPNRPDMRVSAHHRPEQPLCAGLLGLA